MDDHRWVYGTMLDPDLAEHRIRQSGARMTAQRRAVLEILAGNRTHPTADSVITGVRSRLGYVSPATIYNTLEALQQAGFVRRIEGLESRAHFDPDTSQHHHAICRKCGRVWDVEFDQSPAGLPTGFHIDEVLIHGSCEACADRAESSEP